MLVSINHGTDHVEDRKCRIVGLPDGRSAAIWRGLAYPIVDGAIDVGAEGVPPSLCRPPALVSQTTGYGFRETIGGAYVLLSGSVTRVEKCAADLARAGLSVVRSGRYIGEPLPDLQPDWFIRLAADSGGDLSAKVADVLGAPAERIEDTGLRERLLAAELERALESAAAAKNELARIRSVDGELERLRDSVSMSRDLAEAERQRREAAETLATETQRRVDELLSERVLRPQSTTNRSARRIADEIDDVLSALLPRVRLLRDTLDVVATEFLSRQGFYRALGELDRSTQGAPSAWKAVMGASPWIERHVSNGQDNTGRAYARLDRSDRRWEVLISHKGDQPKDIDWLRLQ
jgi:hypothetical protein